jgi:phosphoribosyl-dephospho-CoA transferase
VVVRRCPRSSGLLWPVGVRGAVRAQRSSAWLPQAAVAECITPQWLAAERVWQRLSVADVSPAIAVLDEVAAILAAQGHAGHWGPGGSVGFELATALRCTTPDSDLDLVLQADRPMARSEAARLYADLARLPVRVDVLLETPHGAVSLSEFVHTGGVTLLRAADGPRLVRNPWAADGAATSLA